MNEQDAWQRVALAMGLLVTRMPYIASTILRMEPVMVEVRAPSVEGQPPNPPTIGVSEHWELLWSPAAVEQLCPTKEKIGELAYILLHECVHAVCGHTDRYKAMEKRLASQGFQLHPVAWAWATDLAVNSSIEGCRPANGPFLPCPAGALLPSRLGLPEGLTAEEYYSLLTNPQKGKKPVTPGTQQGGQGGCGSASGPKLEGEPDGQGQGKGKGDAEGQGPSEAPTEGEKAAISRSVLHGMAKASEEAARGRGEGSAHMSLELSKLLAPAEVRWEDQIRAMIFNSVEHIHGCDDADYTRASKKQGGLGYGAGCPVMPSFTTPVPLIGVIQDTSGSMLGGAGSPIALSVREVNGLLAAVGGRIVYCPCDYAVQGVYEVENLDELLEVTTGGGGTSMAPAIHELAHNKVHRAPDLVIVFTDMDIGDPGPEPPFPVIWCNTSGHPHGPMPFGEVINVKV